MDNLLVGKTDPPCFKQDQPALFVVQRYFERMNAPSENRSDI
jgi:hypothetical protein